MVKPTSIANPILVDAESVVACESVGWTVLAVGKARWTSDFVRNIGALGIAVAATGVTDAVARGALEFAVGTRSRH